MLSKRGFVFVIFIFVGIACIVASDLTEGDKAIQKAAGNQLPVYQLWPETGVRSDDHFKSQGEDVTFNNGILRIGKVTRPTMTLFKPQNPDRRCVLVFPGGAYSILAADHEGVQIAKWLNGQGITVFLIKYRVPRRNGFQKHTVALQDAQRAIRLVRSQAKDFGVDPSMIGTLGFSAGGHLTVLTCTQYDQKTYEPVDEHDKVSCRPNFAVPIYPAYLCHKDELDPLVVGPRRDKVPPMFITIAGDDHFAEGAIRFALAAIKGKVPVELHVYERGWHGGGMLKIAYPFSEWVKPCERWLSDLKKSEK